MIGSSQMQVRNHLFNWWEITLFNEIFDHFFIGDVTKYYVSIYVSDNSLAHCYFTLLGDFQHLKVNY